MENETFEDVFLIEDGDFLANHISLQECTLTHLQTYERVSQTPKMIVFFPVNKASAGVLLGGHKSSERMTGMENATINGQPL